MSPSYSDIIICYRYFDIIMILWCYHDISKYQAPSHLETSRQTFVIMILLSIYWYYHDISKNQAPSHLDTFRQPYDIMILLSIFWYYHDISQYQHFVTSRPTFDIMISISIFWQYHDILILSWYLKISSPYISHIQANIWYHDIDTGLDIATNTVAFAT